MSALVLLLKEVRLAVLLLHVGASVFGIVICKLCSDVGKRVELVGHFELASRVLRRAVLRRLELFGKVCEILIG